MVAAQQKNLDALLALSQNLLENLKEGGLVEKTDALLAERSVLLDAVGEMDTRLRAAFEETGRVSGPAHETLMRTVGEIMRLDSESAAVMEREKSEVAGQLRYLGRGGEALKGYRGPGQRSQFVNLKK